MGVKKRNSFKLNWSSTSPIPFNQNAALSGVSSGVMTGTNTIYSNVQDISNFDNCGLEVTYTGTGTGTLSVLVSESGINFYPYIPAPTITQPAGSTTGCAVPLNQCPFKYILLKYINASGTGTIAVYIGSKDLN